MSQMQHFHSKAGVQLNIRLTNTDFQVEFFLAALESSAAIMESRSQLAIITGASKGYGRAIAIEVIQLFCLLIPFADSQKIPNDSFCTYKPRRRRIKRDLQGVRKNIDQTKPHNC